MSRCRHDSFAGVEFCAERGAGLRHAAASVTGFYSNADSLYSVRISDCNHSKRQQAAEYQTPVMRLSLRRHPRMLLSGIQSRTHLDSRLKHAGMTDFR
jgi:hypothetical protein